LLDKPIATAIQQAIIASKQLDFSTHFPLDLFQTGSGTSSNMNVNEVIASLASDICRIKCIPMIMSIWVKAVTMWCPPVFILVQCGI
jgi:fumarate hydratase class II